MLLPTQWSVEDHPRLYPMLSTVISAGMMEKFTPSHLKAPADSTLCRGICRGFLLHLLLTNNDAHSYTERCATSLAASNVEELKVKAPLAPLLDVQAHW